VKCIDVIDVNVITRRHSGGIVSVNKRRVKIRKYSCWFLCQGYLQTVLFDLRLILHTTVSKQQQIIYLQHGGGNCCEQNDVTVMTCAIFIALMMISDRLS